MRRGTVGDRDAVPAHLARVRPQDPEADPHGRRLAGAVRPEEAEDLAARDVERQGVEGQRRREALRDVIDLEAHRRRIAGAPSGAPGCVSDALTMRRPTCDDRGPSVRAGLGGGTIAPACHNDGVTTPASIHADRAAGTLQLEWADGHQTDVRDRRAALAVPVRVLPRRGRPARLAG